MEFVTTRMTQISVEALLKAYNEADNWVISESVLKKLNAQVQIALLDFEENEYPQACLNLYEQVPGKILLRTEGYLEIEQMEDCNEFENNVSSVIPNKLTYLLQTLRGDNDSLHLIH